VNANVLLNDPEVWARRIIGFRCAATAAHGFIRAPFANVESTAVCALSDYQPVPIGGV
jgi:hypothetical protein